MVTLVEKIKDLVGRYKRSMKIAVVSGGFDPIHSGHIDYISEAKKNADYLIVAEFR